ncbi:MAG: SGNH/GDSL hydrolase family protein [Cyanobacteriota bacterium]|jgi:phospholipase/lecithinase/hemolysin
MTVQPAAARLSSLEKLFVFGDSLADTGQSWALTNNTFPPSPAYYQGRASNGPVSPEYLWQSFNPGTTGPAPSSSGGTNYAMNGASTGLVNFNYFRDTTLYAPFLNQGAAPQLSSFLSTNPGFNPSTSLFMVWLFPNDVLSWLSTGQNAGTVTGGAPSTTDAAGLISNGITNIATIVTALAGKGATQFLVPNMPNLGQTPLFRNNPGASTLLSALTAAFNSNLDPALQNLEASLPGVEISRFQTDDLFAEVIADPGKFGFTNVTNACMTPDPYSVCANPDDHLFWDDFHPTTAGQRLIAENFFLAVGPVNAPGPLPLAGAAAALAWSRRLRRRLMAKASRTGRQGCDTRLQ